MGGDTGAATARRRVGEIGWRLALGVWRIWVFGVFGDFGNLENLECLENLESCGVWRIWAGMNRMGV